MSPETRGGLALNRDSTGRFELLSFVSEIDERLWMQVEEEAERQPLLTLGEARAVVHLLELFSHSDREGAEVARHLSGMLARRLPAEDTV